MAVAAGAQMKMIEQFYRLPLIFWEHPGQDADAIYFQTRRPGISVFLSADEMVFVREEKSGKPFALGLAFVNRNEHVVMEGMNPSESKIHYFLGNDPKRWRSNLPAYQEVIFRDLWPNIDMIVKEGNCNLKYDLIVKPGAKIEHIRFTYRGARRLSLDSEGCLVIHTSRGTFREAKPVSYQEIGGTRVLVDSRFIICDEDTGSTCFGFAVGSQYDPEYSLVIDPVLLYSTFLGGNGLDTGLDVVVDGSGQAYVTGSTSSANFPTTAGSFSQTFSGDRDAFVTKLNATGTALIYSTFIGGDDFDEATNIAIDDAGQAYITGTTESLNFPVTPGAFQTTFTGFEDAFVARFNTTGTGLDFATFLGGGGFQTGDSVAIDPEENVYVTGSTDSSDFPVTTGAFQTALAGPSDAYVTKLAADGSALVYSTYLGGTGEETGFDIEVDAGGNAYVTGSTDSPDFSVTPGAFQSAFGGVEDAFVTGQAMRLSIPHIWGETGPIRERALPSTARSISMLRAAPGQSISRRVPGRFRRPWPAKEMLLSPNSEQ